MMQAEKRSIRDAVRREGLHQKDEIVAQRGALAECLAELLMADAVVSQASTIALFASLPDEVDSSIFFARGKARGKTLVFPLCDKETKTLSFHEVHTLDELAAGNAGVLEPQVAAEKPGVDAIELFLIPGVAFARNGARLGRGLGFYDRTLAKAQFASVPRFGLAYSWQVVSSIPMEEFDVPVHKVFTPEEVIETDFWETDLGPAQGQ